MINERKMYWDEDVLRIKNEVRRYEEEQRAVLPAEEESAGEGENPIEEKKE